MEHKLGFKFKVQGIRFNVGFNKFLMLLTLSILIFSCSEDPKPSKKTPPKKKKELVKTPSFNADSAYAFVSKQVAFGPRVPNSAAHINCKNWLVKKLMGYGLQVDEQKGEKEAHDGKILKYTNIIAKAFPEAQKRILLTAHWDTRPWADAGNVDVDKPIDGANDGGSGVAVILEIARLLQEQKPNVGVDIVLFDIEDYGKSSSPNSFCYGSQLWFKNGGISPKPMFGINLDMVGDKNATFLYEGHSMQYARFVLDKVWATAHRMGYQNYFSTEYHPEITDDHYYVNMAGIPCIDIIDLKKHNGTFPATWHTHNDNVQNVSPSTLKAVGSTLLQVIYAEK